MLMLFKRYEQYEPYAHFGYWTLESDPGPNKEVWKVVKLCPKSAKTKWSQTGLCYKPTKLQFQLFETVHAKGIVLPERHDSQVCNVHYFMLNSDSA